MGDLEQSNSSIKNCSAIKTKVYSKKVSKSVLFLVTCNEWPSKFRHLKWRFWYRVPVGHKNKQIAALHVRYGPPDVSIKRENAGGNYKFARCL